MVITIWVSTGINAEQAKKMPKEDLITKVVYLNKCYEQNVPLLKANLLLYSRDVFRDGLQ